MIKAFKNNQNIAVAIDQDINSGVEIDFFNTKVLATDSTARLALKFNAVIIPVFAITQDFRKYEMRVFKELDVNSIEFKTDNKIQELTQLQNNIIEEQIKEKPELWFWQHKRWKSSFKEVYK